MIRFLLTATLFLLIQGCTTFRVGELQTTPLIHNNDAIEKTAYLRHLPVVLRYHSTLGMDNEREYSATLQKLLRTAKAAFPDQQVDFIDNYPGVPQEYLNIHVIQDIPDEREDESTALQVITSIFAGATMLIIPMNDKDIENHIKISHIKNGEKINSTLFNQESLRFVGLTMIPAAIISNSDDTLSATLSDAIQEYLNHEA